MNCGFGPVAPHDLRRTCAHLCHQARGELEQIHFFSDTCPFRRTERYLGCKQRLRMQSTTGSGWSRLKGVAPP